MKNATRGWASQRQRGVRNMCTTFTFLYVWIHIKASSENKSAVLQEKNNVSALRNTPLESSLYKQKS